MYNLLRTHAHEDCPEIHVNLKDSIVLPDG